MLYRSRESRRLTAAYRMIQELRKRFRQQAARAAEEADLIAQEKLVIFFDFPEWYKFNLDVAAIPNLQVKMRDQRIPRMADLTARPFVSGKKTMGTLEAHTNGLRFTSKKHEIVDVMYTNIKHSLFLVLELGMKIIIFQIASIVAMWKRSNGANPFSFENPSSRWEKKNSGYPVLYWGFTNLPNIIKLN